MGELTRRNRKAKQRRRHRVRRLVSFVLAPLVLVTGMITAGFVASPAAFAAGTSQVTVHVTAVDATTSVPITSLNATASPRSIRFLVDYSCLSDVCTNAKVSFDPMQLDPNYNYYRLLVKQGWTAPVVGPPASLTGSDTAGWTVNLGNVTAGTTGQFSVDFTWSAASGAWDHTDAPVQNFPDGFPLQATVRGTADNATVTNTSTATPVTWHIGLPTPAISSTFAAPSSGFFATDTNYSYQLGMGTGCSGLDYICASGYHVVTQLPPGAQYVSTAPEGSMSVNPVVTGTVAGGQTLTWDGPPWSLNPGANGQTSQVGWSYGRTITIRFPSDQQGQTCPYSKQFTMPGGAMTATYISMPGTPGAVKNASFNASGPFTLKCSVPFPRATMDPKQSTYDGASRPPTADATVVIPTTGENDKQWNVTVANTANIPGVAVVTDNTLDLPDLPVYQITTSMSGSTIAWTATDGTNTVSGTSTNTANAPAGYHFVTSTVTSPKLAPPNLIPEQTGRTNFTVSYKYRVTPDATNPTMRRVNTASAVMQWPMDDPAYPHDPFPDTVLGPTSGGVTLIPPFGKIDVWKGSWGSGGNSNDQPHAPATTDHYIPATGATPPGFWWNVYVGNEGNAPAIPTVTDPNLDYPGLPITQILTYNRWGPSGTYVAVPATIQYKLDDGTTGTVQAASGNWSAPAGRRIVSATVTGTTPLIGPNTLPTDTNYNAFVVTFNGQITSDAIPDSRYTNNATGSLNYNTTSLGTLTKDTAATAHLVGQSQTITATMGAPKIAGGASQATTASDVTFTVWGATANVPLNRDMTPEYVFMAPAGWNITPGSASFPAGSVPAGVTFAYNTVTVAGVPRQVAVATWPAGTSWGKNTNLPSMSVIARPSAAVPAGTQSVARGFIGNTATVLPADVFNNQFLDVPDIDSNPATLRFAEAIPPATVPVGSVAAMQVLKEICFPDATQPDGCRWYSDPTQRVGVPPNSTSIKYRISVTNTGNSNLSDVVGYDVLPYPGDTGTSDATATTPRGSTFDETVQTVTTPTNGAVAAYSTSTQPCRAEVSSLTPPACTDDWNFLNPTGAQAIRLTRAGVLAPGTSFSMTYTAAVNNAPGFGAVACNSFAVKAVGLSLVSEPAPVCASIEETDLQITAGTPQLQDGRPGMLPWTVVNNGGAPSTTGEATFQIPAGLQVTSFTPAGWVCTAVDSTGNPVYGTATGPATLTCTPNSPLLLGVPQAINIAVRPTTTSQLTIPAHISGRMFDQNLANNDAVEQVTPTPPAAGIALTKDDGVTTAKPGDTLTYTITAKNTLDFETLVAPTLTDTLPAGVQYVSSSNGGALNNGVVTWTLPDMPGDGTVSRTVTVKVLSTIAKATLTNTANVSAQDPAFAASSLTGTATDVDNVVTNPKITLVKGSTAPTYSALNQTVTYTFSSTNTGDVTLHDVVISDPHPGLGTITYGTWPSGTAGTLNPGDTITATATYKITQADLDATRVDNTATVDASTPGGVGDVHAQNDWTITSTATPSILLQKTASGTVAKANDPVTYTFTITNNGPLTLNTVGVSDILQGQGLSQIAYTWPGPAHPGTLLPGQHATATATYNAKQGDVDTGQIVNVATATGTTDGGVTVRSTAGVTVSIDRHSGIDLVKTGVFTGGQNAAKNDVVDYTFVVTNTGNTTLTTVGITDQLQGISAISYGAWPDPANPNQLLPGQSVTATATYKVTQADVDAGHVSNTATATGVDPMTNLKSSIDTADVPLPATPTIKIVKTATGMVTNAQDPVQYSFTVTNTGTLTLHGVVIDDPMLDPSTIVFGTWPDPAHAGTLLPGQTVTATAPYAATQANVNAGKILNTATTTGFSQSGAKATNESTFTVPITQTPAITLTKDGVFQGGSNAKEGDAIAYSFTVTNTGNVTLTGVTINDPMLKAGSIVYGAWPDPTHPNQLQPGQTVTATAVYNVTLADVDQPKVINTATVTSTDPNGKPVDDHATHTEVLTSTPSITLDKESTSVVTHANDPVEYTFTVTNTGPMTLTGVTITDPMLLPGSITYGPWPDPTHPNRLLPGQTVTATGTYAATQNDVDNGKIANTATVTGTTLTGVETSAEGNKTIDITRTSTITLVKDGHYAPGTTGKTGQNLDYDFTITNTGNTTLTNVDITDQLQGITPLQYAWPDPANPGTLLPGQSATATASYEVTQADVDGLKGVTNTATVTSTSPDGVDPHATATKHLNTPATTGIQLVKTGERASSSLPRVNDLVTYTFAATNLGDLTLNTMTITDPMKGLSSLTFTWPDPATPNTLLPGQTVTATATYKLTQADIDAGKVINTATTVGTPSVGDPVTNSATFTLVLPSDGKLSFHKTGSIADGVWKAGQTVAYGFIVGNTGNVTLHGVTITDPMTGLGELTYTWPDPTKPGVLAPGETATATATYQLTAADASNRSLTNTATASADRAPSLNDSVTLTGPADPPPAAADLPDTGGTISLLPIAGGLVLLGGGLLILLIARRRRERRD